MVLVRINQQLRRDAPQHGAHRIGIRKKMPSSRFLVQTDDFEFKELIKNSSLPCFTTNLATDLDDILKDRVILPVTDPEANVTYHLLQPHFRRSR